ncbi:hypothetical protein ABT390_18150 [Streptomyces aurantiacus]|uniref:Aldehyde dehydrogenase domain-containing protein n=1 Tax=Streptomyces aurantiacus JA 4570 TaxID=1286094 RepID=S3ZCW0_9ACTN|nr:hypothetical protein [Streptomyces aurantiacus]EPH40973.1 hypothetical protein STRAU_5969 [Streptomyces aurantiacus JA 4570]
MTSPHAGPAPVVSAFRRGDWQPSLDTAPLPGTTGTHLALVPHIVAHSDRRWWDTVRTGLPPLPRRRELVLAALELFRHGTVTVGGLGPQSADAFRAALWESAGLPGPLVERWGAMLYEEAARREVRSPDDALALVSLPGNTFTCLDAVLEQAERSAGVWVRPSRREPLSAARLVAALLAAGWPPDRLGLYPTEQHALHGLLTLTDRHVVYGGAGLAASVRASAALTLHGPGRGCALVPPPASGTGSVEDTAAWLLPLIAADSGRFCSNVRTVVCVDHDPEPLAKALAAALDALHPGPAPDPADPRWPLTAFREPAEAHRAAASVRDRLRPGDRLLTREPTVVTREPTVTESTAGDIFIRPQLALLAGRFPAAGRHPLIGHEVPFPFAAVVGATADAARALADEALFVYRPPAAPGEEP